MAGLYIHIPFCAKRCLYCDFFSSTDMAVKERYVEALTREMALRHDYLRGESIETIYFGGGTPSQLASGDFKHLFASIDRWFDIHPCKEITLEANPDDITPAYLESLRGLPFNRISMGVQSFRDEDLRFLNRRHTAQQAERAVALCKQAGLTNISIDLIYGLPGQTLAAWEENLDRAIALDVPHLSAYHLIYEEGTPLYRLLEAGKVKPVDEEVSVALFSTLIDRLTAAGYEHYEISNFARHGYRSRHNSSYWTGKRYLGLGPSAHSYNGADEREWNVSSLARYLRGIADGQPEIGNERLDRRTLYNEFIITGLRTCEGISLRTLAERLGEEWVRYCRGQAEPFIRQGLLRLADNDRLTLSRAGIFISDGIMSDLLKV